MFSATFIRQPAKKIRRAAKLRWISRKADAFLASYPKSGRTWLRYMLARYFNDVYDVGIEVDLHTMFRIVLDCAADERRGIGAYHKNGAPNSLPLVMASHGPYASWLFGGRPVIFLIRDPRDVVVSAYFHAVRQRKRFTGDLPEFINDESQGLQSRINYLNSWARGLRRHDHLLVSYENLYRNTMETLRSVVEFGGWPVDEARLKEAVEAGQFESMRRQEIEMGMPDHDYDRADPESSRMRRGRIAGYREYLTPELISVINDGLSRMLSPRAKELLLATGLQL